MPLYFFHVHDGTSRMDRDGAYFEDGEAAKGEALTATGEFLRDRRSVAWDGSEWRMEVTDAEGNWFLTLRFSALAHV